MAEYSFDVAAQVDLNEVQNAHNVALKQIAARYDFKNKVAKLDFNRGEKTVIAEGSDDYVVGQMMEIFSTSLAKRGVNLKALEEKSTEPSAGGGVRKTFVLRDALKQEECKEITKGVKAAKFKVNVSIQGDVVRVTGKSKDDLQAVQKMVRELNLGAPVGFTNYREK